MLNRRHLRAKTLQILFAHQIQAEFGLKGAQSQLKHFCDKVQEAYAYSLQLFEALAHYETIYQAQQAGKLTNKNNAATIVGSLQLVLAMEKNTPVNIAMSKVKAGWGGEMEILRELYLECIKFEEANRDAADFTMQLFRNVLFKNAVVQQQYEDRFLNWGVDKGIVKDMVERSIKNADGTLAGELLQPLSLNWEEDMQYALDLLQKTIDNNTQLEELIFPKFQNWDAERVAQTDVVLLKMAVAEMLYFDSIPVKVTINEYIDLSKTYSTPKSNIFINGVLDVLAKELTNDNKIVKRGRGLTN